MKRRVQIEGYIWRDDPKTTEDLRFTSKSNWEMRFNLGYSTLIVKDKNICPESSLLYKIFNQDKKKFRIPVTVTFEGEGKELK